MLVAYALLDMLHNCSTTNAVIGVLVQCISIDIENLPMRSWMLNAHDPQCPDPVFNSAETAQLCRALLQTKKYTTNPPEEQLSDSQAT